MVICLNTVKTTGTTFSGIDSKSYRVYFVTDQQNNHNLDQMKRITHKIVIATIIVGGLFIGIVKGQEARSRWVTKMKTRHDQGKFKEVIPNNEVILDDFEIASFHNN